MAPIRELFVHVIAICSALGSQKKVNQWPKQIKKKNWTKLNKPKLKNIRYCWGKSWNTSIEHFGARPREEAMAAMVSV